MGKIILKDKQPISVLNVESPNKVQIQVQFELSIFNVWLITNKLLVSLKDTLSAAFLYGFFYI